jgi:hypothetical protein
VADAYVVDTGVFLRWFIDQDGFEQPVIFSGSSSTDPR